MFNLHVIQAGAGDALLIEFGARKPKFILLDGGPPGIYQKSLRGELEKTAGPNAVLEAVIVSHIDNDHIVGVLNLLAELKSQKDSLKPFFIKIKDLWLNNFSDTIDTGGTITNRIQSIFSSAQAAGVQMSSTGIAINGVKEGHKVTTFAKILKIPLNKAATNGIFKTGSPANQIAYGNLKFTIIGPTQKNLDNLKKDWKKWLDQREAEIDNGNFRMLSMSDSGVPNLSSIMFLAEAHGKTILFTGDGRGDHLLAGLQEKKLLREGKLHVNVYKVAHHGSERNTTREFFEKITADKYVISANGKDGNPDYNTLLWIVETAKEQKRNVELLITNETESTKKIIADHPPAQWGYKISYIPKNANSFKIKVF